jgi:hypothetical protein
MERNDHFVGWYDDLCRETEMSVEAGAPVVVEVPIKTSGWMSRSYLRLCHHIVT